MRRRPAANSSMSLFPFLDTLVCTMGALILMLLAMTPKMKERALARHAAAQAAAVSPEVEPEPEPEPAMEPDPPKMAAAPTPPPEDNRDAERQRRRDAWLAQAAAARSALAARTADFQLSHQQLKDAEQRLRDLQDQVLKIQLKSENAVQASEALDDKAEKLEAQAAVVAQKIAATRKNIDVANRRQATAKNEYALVAYDGTSGTLRRPIYIECTGKGFRFLPEDETVSPVDLEGFSDNFNPLLAGAQTLVRFWSRRKRSSGPAEPEPYVLLLVRPSGCFTYYVARKYLSSLGIHWGYELIEEDWKLSIPDADPVAKTMLRETLDATAQVRRAPKREVAVGDRDPGASFDPREFFERDRADGRSAGAGDDAELGSGRSGRGGGGGTGAGAGRNPSFKPGYATRNDRRGGGQFPGDGSVGSPGGEDGFGGKPAREIANSGAGGAGGSGAGNDSGTGTAARGSASGTGAAGGRTSKTQAAGMGGGNRGGRGIGDGAGSQAGDGSDVAGQSSEGVTLAANGPAVGGTGGPATADGKRTGRTGTGSAIRDPSASDVEGEGGASAKPDGGTRGAGSGTSRRARPATIGGSSSDAAGNREGGDGDEAQPGGFVGDDELSMNPLGTPGKGGTAGLQPASSGSAPGRQSGAPGAAGAEGAASDAAAAGIDGANGQVGKPSWLSDPAGAKSSADGSSPPSGKMGGPGVNVSLGSSKKKRAPDQDDADSGPRISENSDGKPSHGPVDRARGPRKWGQVGRKAGIGFEKKIKIYLNDKRIVIDSKEHMLSLTPADSNEEITNYVVASIDQVADSWGEPPSNFYWVPVVQFVVFPGGNPTYARLQTVLEQKWGVTSTVEYAADRKEKKAAAGGRP